MNVDKLRKELDEEIRGSMAKTIQEGGEGTSVAIDDVEIDSTVELTDRALVLSGMLAMAEKVDDPRTRLDAVLDGDCPHCGSTVQLVEWGQGEVCGVVRDPSDKKWDVEVRCRMGHKSFFYHDDALKVIKNSETIAGGDEDDE